MMALIVGVFAQSCVALLPPQRTELEWFRDGRPFARDVLVAATSTTRTYRRELQNGRRLERVLACTTDRGGAWLVDRVGDAVVRLPVALDVGQTRTANGGTVRRIAAPADADGARGTTWFAVSSPGIAVYGIARGHGVVEIRTPAAAGGFSVLRAVRREPQDRAETPPAETAPADTAEQNTQLQQRIAQLERSDVLLRDSIAVLLRALETPRRVPPSSTEVVELGAVDVYVERGEFASAIELLQSVTQRLRAWSDSNGTRHRALDIVDARLHEVLAACADAVRTARRSRPVQCRVPW